MSLGLINLTKLSQVQSLSPQAQLTIRLLSLNNAELENFLEKKIEDNPLLIEKESSTKDDFQVQPFTDKYTRNSMNLDMINNVSYSKSLREHLIDQLTISNLNIREKIISNYLINTLDDAGYITEEEERICQTLGIDLNFYNSVVTKLQSFEPTGVFSRSLKECLTLQLTEKGLINNQLVLLLNHIQLLADDNFKKLLQIMNITKEELFDLIRIIRKCNPKPGLNYSKDTLEVITPDIVIKRNECGMYSIKLTQNYFSNIIIDETYKDIVQNKVKNNDALYGHFTEAKMILASIAQRQKTLLKVAYEVMLQQRNFLENGINFMKPLNLDKIAKITNLHISTISRSIQNKFIETPRGTFEMKYFFDSGLSKKNSDEEISSKTIENRIKELIKNEKKDDILSDDKIVRLLEGFDIRIARRTVAKYRTKLNILPSSKRKNKFL
ncbi:MAG: RNA polymerase factor sigma-54 [Rhizobiales bacterium]|nr:RNA polymerase factor sigma-54 [Hyphomicrobiales bacterium]MBL6770106.1 RNA polymerase factor sigma-54 [Hyphomicrobiales bacterium]